jgi:hypothetical protein
MDTLPDTTLESSNIYISPRRAHTTRKYGSRVTPLRGVPRPASLALVTRTVKAPLECRETSTITQPSGNEETAHLTQKPHSTTVAGILHVLLATLSSFLQWVFSAFYLTIVFLVLPFIIGACVCYGNLARRAYDYGGSDLLFRFLKSDIGLPETAGFALLFAVSFCLLSCVVKGLLTALS